MNQVTLALAACLTTAALSAVPLTASQAAPVPAAAKPAIKVNDTCIKSAPEPGSDEKIDLCYTTFQPAGSSAAKPVPMIMHSHGWGGSRSTDQAEFATLLKAGYGVLSFDQRGFGETGGFAHVENPAFEGKDVRALVKVISKLDWVEQDGKNDPRLGAIGGSYGGGYQFLGAFENLRIHGKPIFDALAPEITWHDLTESLAPELVVRTEWAALLSAAALPTQALPPQIYKALVEGAATGTWPDGSIPGTENLVKFFAKNGPKHHIDAGRKLDIPVLFGQGTTDTLFPLEQGLTNWDRAITAKARKQSIFVGYNGGHVLPTVLPQGVSVSSDPCSKQLGGSDFRALTIKFFDHAIKGKRSTLDGYGKIHLATPESTCTTVRSAKSAATYDVGTVATTEGANVPLAFAVAEGPISIAGSPYLTGNVTALGLNNRAFYGLAVGTTPADATLIQNNVLPINQMVPVVGAERRIVLPSVAVDVPEGQSLFLIATAFSDTFVGMGSRTPGAILIEDTIAHLPVVTG